LRILRILCLVFGVLGMLAGAAFGAAWAVMRPGPGVMEYKLVVKPSVITVAYKAYGNPAAANGKYWLSKLLFENTGASPLTHVKVSYHLGELLAWTTPDEIPELLPHQVTALALYPKLSSRITQTRSTTPETLEVKIEWTAGDKHEEKTEKRDIQIRGATEIEYTSLPASDVISWYDHFDNSELCACYVTDEDEVVKGYLGKISEWSGGIHSCANAKDLATVMKKIFNFESYTGMTYALAKGDSESVGESDTLIQSIRLPRDVIYQNSGLCIELALLMCTLGRAAGADAYLMMIPGHAFPVLKAGDGDLLAFESTAVGGAPFEKALEFGMNNLKKCFDGEIPHIMVEIAWEQKHGMRPPELERADLAGLAKILNDRLAQADAEVAAQKKQQQQAQPQPQPQAPPRQTTNAPPPGPPAGYTSYDDKYVTVEYPNTWQTNRANIQRVQQVAKWFTYYAANPQNGAELDVYEFGSTDAKTCLGWLAGWSQNLAYSFGDGQRLSDTIVVYPYTMTLRTNGAQRQGKILLITVAQGTLALGMDAQPAAFENAMSSFADILKNHVRIK